MPTVKSLKKLIGKGSPIDWKKVIEGERLRKKLVSQGFERRTLSPGYGRRVRILDDTEHDARVVKIRRSY